MRRPVYLLSVACGISLAAGCGTMRSSPPLVQGSIKTAATTNSGPRGRLSPIVVRLYELKSAATFSSAEFFSLSLRQGIRDARQRTRRTRGV